jgi:tetratricopeptide (TPR) repeat protein
VGLAAVVYEQGDLNQAESWVHQALDLDSKHPESRNLLGLIYWQREDHEEAKRAFLAASRYDPYFLPAEKNLAGLLLETGHHGEALKIYQNILRRFGPFAGRKEIERIVQRLGSNRP